MSISYYFMELGLLFAAIGVSDADVKTLTTAADLLRASGLLYVAGLEFERASEAYEEAVKAAMLSKDFCKGGLILIEALDISELRNANAHFLWRNETKCSLWQFLFLVAHGHQTENKFLEAADLLTKGLTLARQVDNEERRKYLEVEIEWELGELLCGSHHHGESTLQEDGVNHWIIALEILGRDAPDATRDDPSLAEWTRLMRKVRRSLGNWFAQHQRFKEAYDEYMALSRLHAIESKHQLKHHLLAKVVAAYVQFLSGEREEGLMAYEEVVAFSKKDSDLQGDMGFQAEMLTRYSLLLGEHGDKVGRASVKLASIYAALGSLDLAEEENAVAMRIFKDAEEGEYAGMSGSCYVNEALRMANKRHFDEAEQWMERANP